MFQLERALLMCKIDNSCCNLLVSVLLDDKNELAGICVTQ